MNTDQITDHTTAQQWFDLGTATDILGTDPQRVASCYKQALRRDVFNHIAHEALACLWVDAGNGAEAREVLQRATDLLLDPESPDYATDESTNCEVDNSDVWSLCGRVALHAMHQFDLETARFALEKIPPEEIVKYSELYKISLAYAELQRMLMVDGIQSSMDHEPRWGMAEALLSRSKVMAIDSYENLSTLPACRLNPARYTKYLRGK